MYSMENTSEDKYLQLGRIWRRKKMTGRAKTMAPFCRSLHLLQMCTVICICSLWDFLIMHCLILEGDEQTAAVAGFVNIEYHFLHFVLILKDGRHLPFFLRSLTLPARPRLNDFRWYHICNVDKPKFDKIL
jgi:hypothetical protein